MQLFRAKQISTGSAVALARTLKNFAGVIRSSRRFRDSGSGDCRCVFRGSEISPCGLGRVKELCLLRLQRGPPCGQVLALPLTTLVIQFGAVQLLAQLAQRPVTLLQIRARDTELGAYLFLALRV